MSVIRPSATRARDRRRTASRSERGQVLVLFALSATLLIGFSAVAIDGGRNRSSAESNQGYADAAARSGAQLWGAEISTNGYISQPPSPNADPAFTTIQRLASVDGVTTTVTDYCKSATAVTYYDVPAGACPAAPAGWSNSVEVDVPPVVTTGCTPQPYDCIGVILSQVRTNMMAGVLGVGKTIVRSSAIALAAPAVMATSKSWGYNTSRGQLGLGSNATNYNSPQTGPSGFATIVNGGDHVEGIKTDGSLWGWGDNQFGQLDNGTTNDFSAHSTPLAQTAFPLGATAVAVGVGQHHVIVAKNATSLYAFGDNASGQLGDNTITQRPSAVLVTGRTWTNVTDLAGGDLTSYALEAAGTVWAWGENSRGEVGDNSVLDKHQPVQVKDKVLGVVNNLTGITAIASGSHHALAIDSSRNLWSWGWGTQGDLGVGSNSTSDSSVALKVSVVANVVSAAAGENWSIAVEADGSVYAWGDNTYGQLGLAGGADGSSHSTPVKIITGSTNISTVGVVGVAGGPGGDEGMAMAYTPGGALYTWGDNKYGELAYNAVGTNSSVPTLVGGLSGVNSIVNASGWVYALSTGSAAGPGALLG